VKEEGPVGVNKGRTIDELKCCCTTVVVVLVVALEAAWPADSGASRRASWAAGGNGHNGVRTPNVSAVPEVFFILLLQLVPVDTEGNTGVFV